MRKVSAWAGIGAFVLVGNIWTGCTSEFTDCKVTHTCKPGPSAEAGQGGEGIVRSEAGASGSVQVGGRESDGGATDGGIAGGAGARVDEMAGAAGAAGNAGTVSSRFVGCDGEPFEGNEDILRSCILRVGCQPWWYPTDSISRCLSENTQKSHEYQRCSLDAKSCAQLAECTGERLAQDFCNGKPSGKYCNGNELVFCGDAFPYASDCAKSSGTCHDFGTEEGGPGAVCVVPAVSCAGTSSSLDCGGPGDAYWYGCYQGTAWGTKCSQYDQECTGSGVSSACRDPQRCVTDAVACSGNVANVCADKAKWEFDCGSVGLRCQTSGTNAGDDARHCVAPGCTREDVATCMESCEGTELSICYGGSRVTVDCKDYGFSKCSEYEFKCTDYASGDCVNNADVVSYATCE